jgi:hypothetical protein
MRDNESLIVRLMWMAVALTMGACGHRDRDRSEAAQVLRALEVVRAAPNEGKRRPADELVNEPCSSPIVCSARDACGEAYQHLALGTEAALRVKKELDKVENDLPVSPAKMAELSNELDRADTEISGARNSLRRCEEAASLMRRTFGI